MLLIILSHLNITHNEHVSGKITENVTFFCRKLPVAPSISTIIEFNVSDSQQFMDYKSPIMGIYTAYPKNNIDKRCSYMRYGQLHNPYLHPYLRVGRYRTTTCQRTETFHVNCSRRVVVQDFTPRHFYLSFAFQCHWPRIYSLRGLRYNISSTNRSNETSGCIDYSTVFNTEPCSRFYKQTYLPNLIGDVRLNHYPQYFQDSIYLQAILFEDGTCYQHIWEAQLFYTIYTIILFYQSVTLLLNK